MVENRFFLDNPLIIQKTSKSDSLKDSNRILLNGAFDFIKLNYNCPDSEKVGSGKGSCSSGETINDQEPMTTKMERENNEKKNDLISRISKVELSEKEKVRAEIILDDIKRKEDYIIMKRKEDPGYRDAGDVLYSIHSRLKELDDLITYEPEPEKVYIKPVKGDAKLRTKLQTKLGGILGNDNVRIAKSGGEDKFIQQASNEIHDMLLKYSNIIRKSDIKKLNINANDTGYLADLNPKTHTLRINGSMLTESSITEQKKLWGEKTIPKEAIPSSNVYFPKDQYVKVAIDHEIGHIIGESVINSKNEEELNVLADKYFAYHKDIYASPNKTARRQEAFAEMFTLRENGFKLPKDAEQFMSSIHKKGRKE